MDPLLVSSFVARCRGGSSGAWGGAAGTPHELACKVLPLPHVREYVTRTLHGRDVATVEEDGVDFCAQGFTSLATLRKVGVVSGGWVVLSNATLGRQRLARLFAHPVGMVGVDGGSGGDGGGGGGDDDDGSAVFLPPGLLFNLGWVVPPRDKPAIAGDRGDGITGVARAPAPWVARVGVRRASFDGARFDPRALVADEVTIARIACPERTSVSYVNAVKRFFRHPRILAAGDIIGVPLDAPASVVPMGGLTEGGNEPATAFVLFFKVVAVVKGGAAGAGTDLASPPGLLVDQRVTKLEETSKVNGRVPHRRLIHAFLCHGLGLAPPAPPVLPHGWMATARLRDVLRCGLHPSAGSIGVCPAVLLWGERGMGKRVMVREAASQLGVHVFEASLLLLNAVTERKTADKLMEAFAEAEKSAPAIFHLRLLDVGTAAVSSEAHPNEEPDVPNYLISIVERCIEASQAPWERRRPMRGGAAEAVIFVASAANAANVPGVLRSLFTHELEVPLPDQPTRDATLRHIVYGRQNGRLADDVQLGDIAQRTAGRTLEELRGLVARAGKCALERVMDEVNALEGEDSYLDDALAKIAHADFEEALKRMPRLASLDINAPKVPNVKWEDIGGLEDAKQEIRDLVSFPLEHPELFANGLRKRSGILLYGPPGTGKTLLAKAVATECSLNFISVKGPELLDMYVGESEANVRKVFQAGRNSSPCVLFFDELDSLAPARGAGADSGGVMDRVVSSLLAEMDGTGESADVFVIGATNRPDLLDKALLRPGRFDRAVYLGICGDRAEQRRIVEALSRKFLLSEDVDFDALLPVFATCVSTRARACVCGAYRGTHTARFLLTCFSFFFFLRMQCPLNLTGADFYGLCSGAMASSLRRRVQQIEDHVAQVNEHSSANPPLTAPAYLAKLSDDELRCIVCQQDYECSIPSPSISEAELARYRQLQKQFG